MSGSELASTGEFRATVAPRSYSSLAAFLGEERPADMLALLFFLVFTLHAWGILWLLRPAETPITPAQPLMMEVSMITVSADKPSLARQPPAPPAPPAKKPQPKIAQAKPVPRQSQPVTPEKPDIAPAEQTAEAPPAPPTAPSPILAEAVGKATATTDAEQQFTEASFTASYLHNPKPEYPSLARSRGWQGKVKLRVQVSAEGMSETVEVVSSSGHEILDESAVEAVKKWRFVPARHGETAMASSVLVPIDFHFSD